MSEITLTGSTRQPGRKGPARRLRANGMLPGIVYGRGENVAVTVTAKDVLKILTRRGGRNNIINTQFEGDAKKRHVMIKQLDVHPVTDLLLHIDFIEVDMDKPVKIIVQLEFTGAPKGVKEKGGELRILRDRLTVECSPADIPDVISVSITEMDAGQTLHVKDLPLDAKLKALDSPDAAVVSVIIPTVAVAAPAEGEAPKEKEAPKAASKTPPKGK